MDSWQTLQPTLKSQDPLVVMFGLYRVSDLHQRADSNLVHAFQGVSPSGIEPPRPSTVDLAETLFLQRWQSQFSRNRKKDKKHGVQESLPAPRARLHQPRSH